MVLERLFEGMLGAFAQVMTAVLPTDSVSLSSADGFVHWYSWLNGFLPVAEGVELIATAVGVLGVIGAFAAVMTLWRAVPGKAT